MFIKKRVANGVILIALFAIFFPWTRCMQGKKVFPPATPLSLSLLETQKTQHNLYP